MTPILLFNLTLVEPFQFKASFPSPKRLPRCARNDAKASPAANSLWPFAGTALLLCVPFPLLRNPHSTHSTPVQLQSQVSP